MPAHAGSELQLPVRHALESAKVLYLATQRANGQMSSVSPVWFMYDGRAVYFATSPQSYKAKRIRRGRRVDVWVGSRNGPHFTARGKLLKDVAVAETMERHYRDKYWLAWLGFFRPSPSRLKSGEIVLVRLLPAPAP